MKFLSCTVDCDWGAWSNWTECNKECGGGTEYRERVKSQVEKYGGRPCDGLSVDSQSCNTHFCPSKSSRRGNFDNNSLSSMVI